MRARTRPATHRLLLAIVSFTLALAATSPVGHVQTLPGFASRIVQLSEPGGYFDTDNLISNEKSYLHVIPALRDTALRGGAYVGVGPDQNFSYIAELRPSIAFIIDIRRDNLLLHLLFKALFSLSDTRAEYLSLLFGRPAPTPAREWRQASIERLADYIDSNSSGEAATTALRRRVDDVIKTFGVALSSDDLTTIDRFHRTFINAGLPLKFVTTGRRPQVYYPTYRELLLEEDRQGHHANFLASEDGFQFVRSLERRDLVIPVVGDLAGPSALAAIARLMTERGDRLSAFYTSNVEFYLFGDGRFAKFIDNLSHMPHTSHSLIIRSVFGGYVLRESAPGYYSTSLVQRVDALLDGFSNARIRTYNGLIGR